MEKQKTTLVCIAKLIVASRTTSQENSATKMDTTTDDSSSSSDVLWKRQHTVLCDDCSISQEQQYVRDDIYPPDDPYRICTPTACCVDVRDAVNKCHFECVKTICDNLPNEWPKTTALSGRMHDALVYQLRYLENLTAFYINDRFGHLKLNFP